MKYKRTFILGLGANLLLLLFIYLPYVFRSSQGLELLGAGLQNLVCLAIELLGCVIVAVLPATRTYATVWWLNWGLLLLFSFPVCLATAWLNGVRHQ